jgi:hypothetical protein
MNFSNLISFLGLCSIATIGFFSSKSHPILASAAFDTISIQLLIAIGFLKLRKGKLELGVLILFSVFLLTGIYIHVANSINPIDLEYLILVLKLSGLVVALAGIGLLLIPKRR